MTLVTLTGKTELVSQVVVTFVTLPGKSGFLALVPRLMPLNQFCQGANDKNPLLGRSKTGGDILDNNGGIF